MLPLVNSPLEVLTATIWQPLASLSVFKAINLGSENNYRLQLETNSLHELKKGQYEHCLLIFHQIIPCLVLYNVQLDYILFEFTRFLQKYIFFLLILVKKKIIFQLSALGGGWGGGIITSNAAFDFRDKKNNIFIDI